MSYDHQAAAAKTFSYIAPRNPIGQLKKADQVFLWALLVVYSRLVKSKQEGTIPVEPLENILKLLSKVARLAEKLESEIFEGPMSEILLPYTANFHDLPSQMVDLSTQLKKPIVALGKPGSQRAIFTNAFLVQASEFVRLKTGQHYDEHLAVLFQGIANSDGTLGEELSGDAIRKKRVYMAAVYPDVYEYAVEQVANRGDAPKNAS